MDLARLLAKLRDKTGERLLKAIVFSTALHLGLMLLIQPARWTGPNEVVLQARIAAATTPPAARAPAVTEAKTEQPTTPEARLPPPTERASTPAPIPAPPVPPPTEAVTHTDAPAPTAQAGEVKTAEPGSAAVGPATGLPEIPVMLDNLWYTAREVDRRPELLIPVLPVYPEEARRRGIQGSVVIEVHIDESGRVREIEVLEANPPGVFDAVVLEVYGQARYSPAILNGRPVRYIGKYRVLFELD